MTIAKVSYEHIPMDTAPEEVLARVDQVHKGYRSGITIPIEKRLEQLRNLYYGVKDYQDLIAEGIEKDLKRNALESNLLEFQGTLHEIDHLINKLPAWSKDESVGWPGLKFFSSSPVISRIPYGSVLIITPWNYPVFLSLVAIATAIAAGNTVLWKPTEIIPNTSKSMTLMIESVLDPDVVRVVNGGIPETSLLLEQKWDKIMVTGSTRVGRIVAQAAAKHLTPTLLELGGKSPTFVSRTADLRVSARRIIWGKLANAGQTCVAPDYILVERGIEDKLITELKKSIEEFYPNMSKDDKDFAHIPNERLYSRLAAMIDNTKGRIVHGGHVDAESLWIEPTIVADVVPGDSTMDDEIFGPVLPLISVDNLENEGVDFVIEHHDTPLALYVFTNDKKQADLIMSKTRSGGSIVNDTLIHVACSSVPFGGIGESGVGAYHGKHGFDAFSHQRAVLRQPFWAEFLINVRYPPFTAKKNAIYTSMSEPKPWYGRTGPVKRSFTHLFKSVTFWFAIIAAAVGYKVRNRL